MTLLPIDVGIAVRIVGLSNTWDLENRDRVGTMIEADNATMLVDHDGGEILMAKIGYRVNATPLWIRSVHLVADESYLVVVTGTAEQVTTDLIGDWGGWEVVYPGELFEGWAPGTTIPDPEDE